MSLECYGKAWRQALLSNKQIATNIKPETTVVTTEIDRSQPETTTFQQETSMLPACVCTCKISHMFCPAILWKKTLNV